MTPGPANLIKTQILANLNALVASGVLGSVVERDLTMNPLTEDLSNYPVAMLGSSNMTANWEYIEANRRTYQFNVLVVTLVDNLSATGNPGYVEDVRDAIALQFDNNFTLAGTAQFGVRAVFSVKEQVTERGKRYVTFWITLQAVTIVPLSYSF